MSDFPPNPFHLGIDVEHVVTRINAHYFVCEACGRAGSERWAILHQFSNNDWVELTGDDIRYHLRLDGSFVSQGIGR
jgi:hypothetical protein